MTPIAFTFPESCDALAPATLHPMVANALYRATAGAW